MAQNGRGDEKVHIVLTDQEIRRKKAGQPRTEGAKPQTRLVIDCVTNDAFRLLFAEYDRIFSTVVNKTMFIDFLIEMFRVQDEAAVKAWVERGHEADPPKPEGPPKAELPKWAQP